MSSLNCLPVPPPMYGGHSFCSFYLKNVNNSPCAILPGSLPHFLLTSSLGWLERSKSVKILSLIRKLAANGATLNFVQKRTH